MSGPSSEWPSQEIVLCAIVKSIVNVDVCPVCLNKVYTPQLNKARHMTEFNSVNIRAAAPIKSCEQYLFSRATSHKEFTERLQKHDAVHLR
jgi:hypothetical protein